MKVRCDYCGEYKPVGDIETFTPNAQTDEARKMCADCSDFVDELEPEKEEFDSWEDCDRYFTPQWGRMLEGGIK